MLQNSTIKGKENWAKAIKTLVTTSGIGYVWMNGGVRNKNSF